MKAAIFDMDGTLLDSMHIWDNVHLAILNNYAKGIKVSEEFIEHIITLGAVDSAVAIKEYFNLNESAEEIMAYMNSVCQELYVMKAQLKPGAIEILEQLKKQGVKIAAATATNRNLIQQIFERLDLLKYFDFTITCDEAGKGKTQPDIYNICAEKLGEKAEDIMVFEDAITAITTAKNAGFQTTGVYDLSWDYAKDRMIATSDRFIMSFSEIL